MATSTRPHTTGAIPVLALNPDGSGTTGGLLDSYTPANYQQLQATDADLGSTAPAILPAPATSRYPNLAVMGGKDQLLRLVNLDNLSGQGARGKTGGEIGPSLKVPQGGRILHPTRRPDQPPGSQHLDFGDHRHRYSRDQTGC